MPENLTAEVITIGTELLLGEITDTNSVHIAQCLRNIGVNLYYMTTVGDNENRIANAISIALSRADIVITCGGLGPTVDDMTRSGVAKATDRSLIFHQELFDQIAARFEGFRVHMTENNRQQAYLPNNSITIENPVGTAPSFIVEHNGGIVISLPGVPREMKFLMKEQIIPYLQGRYQLGIIKARVLKTAGIGESSLDDMIGRDLLEKSNPSIGLAAHQGQVDVRVTAKAKNEAKADEMINALEIELRRRIGTYIYGTDSEKLEDVLIELLSSYRATIAVNETGIGDIISARILSHRQSDNILAKVEHYEHPDQLKQSLATNNDITMRDLAEQTAKRLYDTSMPTIAVTVITDPNVEESSDDKQGTAIALYTPQNTRSRYYGFGGRSELAKIWATNWALAAAWQLLKEMDPGN